MQFAARRLAIPDVVVIVPRRVEDERGFFVEMYRSAAFRDLGMPEFVQDNQALSHRKGTIRALHFQRPPHAQAKLVRVLKGAIFDVAVDLRLDSPTYGRWIAAELSADNGRMLYIPPGCAHGFQTLADDTELLYQIAPDYEPGLSRGVRWNDPTLGIAWPIAEPILSERDRTLPVLAALAA